MILNNSLALSLFGKENPIGKQVQLINPAQSTAWRSVVGVVGDVKYSGLDDPGAAAIYTPFAQTPFLWSYLFIRTSKDAAAVMAGVREAFSSVDPNARPRRMQSVRDLMSGSVAQPRFNTILLSSFAVLALILAATGLYGVVSYAVTQQTREIGIRVALGAKPSDIFRFAMGNATQLTIAGLVAGSIGAFAVTRLMSGLLFNVGATDLATYATVAFILAAVAALASYIPARRATRIDPAITLRN